MLIKIGVRQATRQLKANCFHMFTLVIIFMVTFVLATYAFDKELTANLTSTVSSELLNRIGGMESVFRVFLILTAGINLFFLTYIFRLRLRRNSKMYALYRLLGMKSGNLFILYIFEVIVFTLCAAIIGGLFGVVTIRVVKIFLLMFGSFVETKVEFSFSFMSYLIAVALFFIEMTVAVLFSLVIIIRTDIILLFKRDQLVQKVSKMTPVYIVLALLLFLLLPQFAKLGEDPSAFFMNFGIAVCLSSIAMFLLYKSAITSLFSIRRSLNLNKRHGSEFITGRFFFSELNKSAMMMTIVSFFLSGIFLFSFISQMFITPKSLEKTMSNDFSMLSAQQADIQQVEQYLQSENIQYYTTDLEYIHIAISQVDRSLVHPADMKMMIEKTREDESALNEVINNYSHFFILSDASYQKQIKQLKQANRQTYQIIDRLYQLQTGAKIRYLSGVAGDNIAGLPGMDTSKMSNISIDDLTEVLKSNIRVFNYPTVGTEGSMLTLTQSSVFTAGNEAYNELKQYGIVQNQQVFNAPSITNQQFRRLHEKTVLSKYDMMSTVGKSGIQLVNAEVQSPILLCLSILFFQVLFYITILIIYRLTEMIQKQYRVFQTLHIIGASNSTIVGSVFIQSCITMLFPISVSFYVAWVAVSGVFKDIYTPNEILENVSKYLPHVTIVFLLITMIFVIYQSVIIRRQFKA